MCYYIMQSTVFYLSNLFFFSALILMLSKKTKNMLMLNISRGLSAASGEPQGPYLGELCSKHVR